MIYITGDTHGNWMSRLKTEMFPEQKEMTKNDFVIVLGDFGIWTNSKEEQHNLDWLHNKPFTTLFIDGNHENFDLLSSFEEKEWHGGKIHEIRPSVFHLMRGQVFDIEGKTFFTFGGAKSHDISDGILDPEKDAKKIKLWKQDYTKRFRVNHVSWWENELPSFEEMQTGLCNLEKYGNKVDYILSHCPYTSILKQLDGGSGMYAADYLTDYLQKIHQLVDHKQWFFGHMHQYYVNYWERATCLYESIRRIV